LYARKLVKEGGFAKEKVRERGREGGREEGRDEEEDGHCATITDFE